ncbi:FAD-dependent oxidoreductase [Streptomyces iconiensis]|uniref:FAD-dependent oxidoreductase n=1 Tax=Streptomyces iconiensis TaxID=1384038 RepID=A0ABT7A2Z5_9ACTN|nr:FAD-dependent oxidoreductase [Streptomyces iconiensis]MDJ1135661.1 FAD-dependent oxidoreductase [Streptomyces iconiensis]
MRIGIAGGGLAGLAVAWLLDGVHETVLVEERPRLGGNAESVTVRHGGRQHQVDLGVRETSPQSFTTWLRIAQLVGVTAEEFVVSRASRTLTRDPATTPLWVSPSEPGSTGRPVTSSGSVHRALLRLATDAARWEAEDLPWETTLGEAVSAWRLPEPLTSEAVCALPASLFGCTLDEARTLSARAVGALYADPQPDLERAPELTFLRGGADSLTAALAAKLRTASVHLDVPLRHVVRKGGDFELIDAAGHAYAVDAVVLALPADRAAAVLDALAGTDGIRTALADIPHRNLTYGLHLDPFGMPADRRAWSADNVTLHGPWSETTTWYGPATGDDLFVSQLTHRDALPRLELARSHFRTQLPTPAAHRARARLAAVQGRGGLFIAGRTTADVDTQETALYSAAAVARQLAPESGRIRQVLRGTERT